MNRFKPLFFLLAFFVGLIAASSDCSAKVMLQETLPAKLTWDEVIEYAKENISNEGILSIKSDGFVYLRVNDDYIHRLFPMLDLKKQGYREPPYFRNRESPGAHISVFYSDEHVSPTEVGRSYYFQLKKIQIVHPSKHVSYAVLEVYSPKLEELRVKYGKSPKLHGHEFHISIAKKEERRY